MTRIGNKHKTVQAIITHGHWLNVWPYNKQMFIICHYIRQMAVAK